MKKLASTLAVSLIIMMLVVLLFISWNNKPKNFLPKDVYNYSAMIKTLDGYTFRDLNKNGKLDVYEDARQPIEARINDVLSQMTLEEKAGMMFINGARVNDDGTIEDKPGKGMFAFAPNGLNLMKQKQMNHFNLWAVPSTEALAKWYNSMQKYAEDSTRLGIPITIASDPRNHFSNNIFAMSARTFSQWCEPWFGSDR
jgi:beta-glucosidase